MLYFFLWRAGPLAPKHIYLSPVPGNMENSYARLSFSGLTLINVICTPLAPETDPAYESCAIKFQSSLLDERLLQRQWARGGGKWEGGMEREETREREMGLVLPGFHF